MHREDRKSEVSTFATQESGFLLCVVPVNELTDCNIVYIDLMKGNRFMQERYNENYSVEQNQLVFRTPPGSRHIPAGERVRLNDGLPNGIPVADFKTIRLYARCRPDGTVSVTFGIFVLDVKEEDLIFRLDGFTLKPEGEDLTRTYDVSGRALVVFAQGGPGIGGTGIDFGVLGFGPQPCLIRSGQNHNYRYSGRY